MLSADHAEVQAWFAEDAVENSLQQLKQDLDDPGTGGPIEVLTAKGVFSITDLPPGARLLSRSSARKALGGLNNLIERMSTAG
jgi:16S rRNA G1207 methylase RsmC